MIGAIAVAVFVFAAASGFGWGVLRLLRMLPDRAAERWLWAAVVGQPIFGLAVLAAGAAGALSTPLLWGLCFVGLGVGAAARPWERAAADAPRGWLSWTMVALIALSAVYGFLRSATPPTHDDTLGYHFAAPKLYLEQGAITRLDGMPRAWWPALAQMHWTACLALGSDRAAQAFNVLEMLWVALALAALGRRLFTAEAGLVAAAIFLSLAQSKHQAATGSDMFFLSLYAAAALSAALDGKWGLCGVALGAAASTKLPGLMAAAVVGAAALALGRRRAFIPAIVALMIASPWYTRLVHYTGNPVWPFMTGTFGTGPWSEAGIRRLTAYIDQAGHDDVPLVYGVTLYRSHYLLAAALLLVFWRPWKREHAALTAAWLAGATIAWLSSPQSRMQLPYQAWLAVLAGGGVVAGRRWGAIAAVALIAFHIHHQDFFRVRAGAAAIVGRLDRDAYLKREQPAALAYDWVNAHAPNEPVLLLDTNLIYLRRGPFIVGDPLMQDRWNWAADNPRDTGARWMIARSGDRPVIEFDRAAVFRVRP